MDLGPFPKGLTAIDIPAFAKDQFPSLCSLQRTVSVGQGLADGGPSAPCYLSQILDDLLELRRRHDARVVVPRSGRIGVAGNGGSSRLRAPSESRKYNQQQQQQHSTHGPVLPDRVPLCSFSGADLRRFSSSSCDCTSRSTGGIDHRKRTVVSPRHAHSPLATCPFHLCCPVL